MRGVPGIARTVVAVALTLSGLAGCGGPSTANVTVDADDAALSEVGEMYRLFLKEHGKPPRRPKDFERYAAGFDLGAMRVLNGEIVVLWGASPAESADPGTVLAYEKAVPEQGGKALMLDSTVRRLSPEEFRAAPKAGAK